MLSRNDPDDQNAAPQSTTSMLDAALHYARSGIAIFPCDPRDKKPLTRHGFKDATRDEGQIRAWWTTYPHAMIGIPTGEVNGIWAFDVDLDPAKNVNGFVPLAELIAQHGELPKTLTSITPRGGRHLVFNWQEKLTLRNSKNNVASGLDVRANGGYIIAPPSVRDDGVSYRWDADGGNKPVDAPDWLIALLSPQKSSTGRVKPARKNPQKDLIWARTALEEECKLIAAAPYGQRNNALNRGAYNIFQIVWGNPGLLDENEVRQQLFAAAEESELVEDDGADSCWRTIESAGEGAKAQPRKRPQQTRLDLHLAGAGTSGAPQAGAAPAVASAAASAPSAAPAAARRIVQLHDGGKSFTLDQVEDELAKQEGFGIYQRGGQLVHTVLTRTAAHDHRSTLIWQLAPVDTPHVFEVFSRIVDFQKYDRRARAWVPTDCPWQLPEMYQGRRHWRVPTLLGIVHTPQLRADGSLVEVAGYDPGTRLLFRFDGEVFPPIPAHPTREDALVALKLIEDAISTFPFRSDVDRAVLLSLFLTALCRRNFEVAPMHAVTAPTSGTGKSLLISLASILACGQTPEVIAQGDNDQEFRKLLGAELMKGTPIIAIDNCQEPLTGDLLCQAVTEAQCNVRVLGHSRTVLVPASALITATGNNLTIGSDISRRVLLCAIDAGVERPEKRKFKVKIKKLFRQRRGELVGALLTVLRAARLAQAEIVRLELDPLGGFEDWCEWVRDPLVWLGREDPCASMDTSYESNVDREALRTVLFAWCDHVNLAADTSAQQVIDQADQMGALGTYRFPALREALLLVAEERGRPGHLSAKRLGWWLRKINGRPVDGLRLVKVRGLSGQTRWRLQK